MKRKPKSGASRPLRVSSNSKTKTGSTSSTGSRVRRKNASMRSTKSAKNIPFGGMDLTDDYKEFVESLNAGVDDLVLTKKGTGRLQDLADIEQLGKKVSLKDR